MIDRSLDIPLDCLAPSVEEVASICDMETALRLVEYFGGCRFWVPQKWREDHDLNVIGEANAKLLIARLGGDELSIPIRPFTSWGLHKLVNKLIKTGKSQREIAQALNITMRAVRCIKTQPMLNNARLGQKIVTKDPRQIDLEDYLKKSA